LSYRWVYISLRHSDRHNHYCKTNFILDAVVGAIVYSLGWSGHSIFLNLLPLEDYFLWGLRTHKPEPLAVRIAEFADEDECIITCSFTGDGRLLILTENGFM
jgi:hypothetical protein